MISSKIKRWFLNQKRKHKLKVKIIDINNIKGWILDRDKIYHKSKKFFKIIGIIWALKFKILNHTKFRIEFVPLHERMP